MIDLRDLDEVADSRPLSMVERGKREHITIGLEKVILMEEICWRQKSHALWLKEGDKNSKFFHWLASSHRIANTILINGITFTNQDEIQDTISLFDWSRVWNFTTSSSTLDFISSLSFIDHVSVPVNQ